MIIQACAEGEWGLQRANELAQMFDLNRASVYKRRKALMRSLVIDTQLALEERRQDIMLRCENEMRRAWHDGRSATSALRLFSEITGVLSQPPPVVINVAGDVEVNIPRLVEQVQQLQPTLRQLEGPVIDHEDL